MDFADIIAVSDKLGYVVVTVLLGVAAFRGTILTSKQVDAMQRAKDEIITAITLDRNEWRSTAKDQVVPVRQALNIIDWLIRNDPRFKMMLEVRTELGGAPVSPQQPFEGTEAPRGPGLS